MNNDFSGDLAAIYEKKVNERGLLDAKFLIRPDEEVGTDEVRREVISFNEAIANGRVQALDFGDLRWVESK